MKDFRPMLAATLEDVNALDFPLLASYKLDGIRCVITEHGPRTRSLKHIPNEHISRILAKLPFGLDGELIVIDTGFRGTSSAIMTYAGEPNFTYYIFDDFSNPDLQFHERLITASQKCSPPAKALLQYPINSVDDVLNLYDQALTEGFEGLILRDPSAPYKYGRSTLSQQWMLKLKPWVDEEATVIAVEEEQANDNEPTINALGLQTRSSHQENKIGKARVGALVVESHNRKFSVGTGFTEQERIDLWQSPPIGKVIKFKYLKVGGYDLPRHPVFLEFVTT